MIETLLGGLLGGLTRLAPEVLKFIDRKAERQHELDLLSANLESDKAKLAGQLAVSSAETQSQQFSGAINALKESVSAQGQRVGIAFIDGINALVRPGVTYILFGMWTMIKLVTLVYVIQSNPALADLVKALPDWWKPDDQAMLAAVLNFWFLGRVFDKVLS